MSFLDGSIVAFIKGAVSIVVVGVVSIGCVVEEVVVVDVVVVVVDGMVIRFSLFFKVDALGIELSTIFAFCEAFKVAISFSRAANLAVNADFSSSWDSAAFCF